MKKRVFASLAVSLLMMSVFALAGEGKTERIAVAANGQTPASTVGKQPGRAVFFLFFDKQGTFIEAVDNPYKDAGSAGISTVDFLAGKGVSVLVAEGYGPKIVEVMKGKGIRAVTFTGTAADAVKKLLGAK
jgi:predicted Fe-Mo cluster-binding NifX family protein